MLLTPLNHSKKTISDDPALYCHFKLADKRYYTLGEQVAGLGGRPPNTLNSPHPPQVSRFRVSYKQQHENHPEKRNQPRDNDNRIECMSHGGLPGIGKMPNELERDDSPYARASPAE